MRSTVQRLHIPLFIEMLEAAGHTDHNLVHDLIHGFAVIGEMDAGGQGTDVEGGKGTHGKPANYVVPDLEELHSHCQKVNARTLAQAEPDQNAEAVWEKTKEEVKRGLISALVPVADVDLRSVLLVRRFGISQLGVNGWKIRPIDDFRHNEANKYAMTWESTSNDREDTITAAITMLQQGLAEQGVEEKVLVGLEDFVSAFKTVAPTESQRWAMHMLVFDTDARVWRVGELLTMPFGAMGSVLAWWRCATAQKIIMRRLFEMLVFYYIDDVQQIETQSTAAEGKEIFQKIMNTLGWALDEKNSQDMSSEVRCLGSSLQVTEVGVTWSLCQDKAERWDEELRQCQKSDVMSAETAGRLCGKLQFGAERVFGRAGRAALRPLVRRQHSSEANTLTKRLRSCIRWWRAYLATNPKRSIFWNDRGGHRADVIIYTDAERFGRIGIVALNL